MAEDNEAGRGVGLPEAAPEERSPKVVGLRGQPIYDKRTPQRDVIELAERLLEMAKSGEIVRLHAVWGYYDDTSTCRSSGNGICAGEIVRLHWLAQRYTDDFMR